MRQLRLAARLVGSRARLLVEGRNRREPLCTTSWLWGYYYKVEKQRRFWDVDWIQVTQDWVLWTSFFFNTSINFVIATRYVLDGPGIESR